MHRFIKYISIVYQSNTNHLTLNNISCKSLTYRATHSKSSRVCNSVWAGDCVCVCVLVLPFVAQSFMCVAHNNGGFSLFDVNFLFLLLLSQLLVLFLHLSLLERTIGDGASSGGRQGLAGTALRTLKFDKLMFALILCCNYFNNLHPAPTALAAAALDRRETKEQICFCRLPPNSWQTVAMSPPLPVRTRSRRRRRSTRTRHQSCANFSFVLSAPRIIIKC